MVIGQNVCVELIKFIDVVMEVVKGMTKMADVRTGEADEENEGRLDEEICLMVLETVDLNVVKQS